MVNEQYNKKNQEYRMKKLKILLVTEYFPPKIYGGGEISAQNLAKKLAESKHNVTVLTSECKDMPKEEKINGYKILRRLKTGEPNSISGNFRRRIRFQRSLKKELLNADTKFDVIHFLNTTAILNFKLKTKTVATINGYTNFCPKRNLFYKEKETCDGCCPGKFVKCITKSSYLGKQKNSWWMKYNPLFWIVLYKQYIQNKAKLKNIDRFISISKFIDIQLLKNKVESKKIVRNYNIPNLKTEGPSFKINQKGVNFVYVGYLEKIKGVEMLVKAFNKIEKANLLIFGAGAEKKKLQKIAGKKVKFYGSVDYKFIPSIYQQADVIIQPALWPEPMSRIILEATYFGKPIIATNNGGNSEGVIDERNGFLIENENMLTKKINELAGDKQLRTKMGVESKKIFAEKFESKKILEKTMKIYSK